MVAARVASMSRRPQAQSKLNCRFVRGEPRRPASRDTTRAERVSAPPRILPTARKVSKRASLVGARRASWVMPASGGLMRALGAQPNGARRAYNKAEACSFQLALFEPASGTPPVGARTSRGALRPHLVVILLQSGATIMRDARGMCPVPPQRNAALPDSGAEPLRSSTAFSHDDRTTPVPSQITSRCIRRLG